MSDVLHKVSRIAHGVAFGLGVVAHALSPRRHFHMPHFHIPRIPAPRLNPRLGLHCWFHAQRRIPRSPRPLPMREQAMHDRMVGRLMARAHGPRVMHRDSRIMTPPYRGGHGMC